MAKHPCAVYYDRHQQRHQIKVEELRDPRKLEEARGNKLFDASEEFRMSVRGGQSPHFFALATGGRLLADAREEADPAHNERIEYLVSELNTFGPNQTIELGTNAWNEETKEQEWAPFAEICGYRWKGEVTRALSATTRCRHDVFGARAEDLNLTGRFPWVAIEVIHHHYPTPTTLAGLLKMTELLPLVVLFDLVVAPNYFMQIDHRNQRIRAVFYLYLGRIWRNDRQRPEDMTAEQFEAAVKTEIEKRDERKKNAARNARHPGPG